MDAKTKRLHARRNGQPAPVNPHARGAQPLAAAQKALATALRASPGTPRPAGGGLLRSEATHG
jgi:hypothetical protein